ncbi:MAG: 4-hydroxythreonine-4-phosphate dehydrogenase PdxA [Clostridiales bacterium]|jgi:4-hydroxythreonine-4-phosphate dehydrogenase|nr:4-hydroxythreonine-4-phosphate dehydrogenase PdxA [Clostridiales bacterium]
MFQRKPLIAIPMGDPAGIGPEIAVKALLEQQTSEVADCFIVGDTRCLSDSARLSGLKADFHTIQSPTMGVFRNGIINVIDLNNADPADFRVGEVSAFCGRASYEYIEKSVSIAMSGEIDAIATTPINKESLKAANIPFIGHTEIMAGLTLTDDPLTMFEVRGMRVFFLSRHVSLRKSCDLVTTERIIDTVMRSFAALEKLGVENPKMAIAGLNPHSGEHGLFGTEEVEEIAPAIETLREMGYNVCGPIAADSVFHLALNGRFDSVLSLYHDQGHIATKTLDFERTVSVTNGLPFLRTSVDHGTAFDIAGKGTASPVSMIEAILVAAKYAPYFVSNMK